MCLLYSLPVHSQTQLGPQDCNATLNLAGGVEILSTPPGTVCLQCVFDGVVATDATYSLEVNSTTGRVVNGVLVVFDSETVFNTRTTVDIQCNSALGSHITSVFLMSKSY